MVDQVKISALPPAGSLAGTESVPIIQAGVTKRATMAQVAEAVALVANDAELIPFVQDGTGAATDTIDGKLRRLVIHAEDFGAVAGVGTALARATAINLAISYLVSAGGGTLKLRDGVDYELDNTNSGAASWDNYRAIFVGGDNVTIEGGPGTVLSLVNGADCHVIQVGQRTTSVLVALNTCIRLLRIDGNRANQTAPTDVADHWQGVAVASACHGTVIEDCTIGNCQYYAIGFQRDDFERCAVRRVYIHDTGADAIDCKDDSEISFGNVIEDVTVERHGLSTGLLTEQAGIDVRGGWEVRGVRVVDFGTTGQGKVGIRTQQGTSATGPTDLPTQAPTVRDFYVKPNTVTGTTGVRLATPHAMLIRGEVQGCANGVYVSHAEAHVSNVFVWGGTVGFRMLNAGTAYPTNGMYFANVARSNSQAGFVVDSGCDGNDFQNCNARANGIGFDIRTGATNTKILGGSSTANTTQVSDSGSSTLIRNLEGCRTEQALMGAASIALDSTGVKNVTFNHLLGFTPSKEDVDLTLVRDTNIGDWSGWCWVTATTSTTITAQVRVITASATAGAVCKLRANVRVKNGL